MLSHNHLAKLTIWNYNCWYTPSNNLFNAWELKSGQLEVKFFLHEINRIADMVLRYLNQEILSFHTTICKVFHYPYTRIETKVSPYVGGGSVFSPIPGYGDSKLDLRTKSEFSPLSPTPTCFAIQVNTTSYTYLFFFFEYAIRIYFEDNIQQTYPLYIDSTSFWIFVQPILIEIN